MGLLDSLGANPEAFLALSGGLLRGDFGGGVSAYGQAMREGRQDAIKNQLLKAQIAETEAQAQERQANARKQQEALALAARQQAALPGLFRQPGMTGGEAVPQTLGGEPMFSQPMGAAPMRQSPGGFDVMGAIRAGFDPKTIEAYAGLQNVGRQEVARTVETMRNGKPVTMQFDKYGQPVGEGQEQWKAPIMQNLGNRTVALDPVGLGERGSFAVGQSPDSAASNSLGWANFGLSKQRLAMEQNQPKGQYDTERGVMIDVRTGTASPVMQGGQPLGPKDKNMTDAQAKALLFGSRAQASDEILNKIAGQGVTRSSDFKRGVESIPLIGSGLGALANASPIVSGKEQQIEQAQRDFINAVLRRESGAVISQPEFDNAARQYFPQIGDTPEVIKQKKANRALATRGVLAEVPENKRGSLNSGATGGWGIKEIK